MDLDVVSSTIPTKQNQVLLPIDTDLLKPKYDDGADNIKMLDETFGKLYLYLYRRIAKAHVNTITTTQVLKYYSRLIIVFFYIIIIIIGMRCRLVGARKTPYVTFITNKALTALQVIVTKQWFSN